jgi:hypothetical protein
VPTTDADRDAPPPRTDSHGVPMRYQKAETILRIALDMQGSALGLSLDDIQRNYADELLSRKVEVVESTCTARLHATYVIPAPAPNG